MHAFNHYFEKMNLTDTHSHLYDAAFDDDRGQAIRRAATAGVRKIVLPAIDSQSHEQLFEICRKHPDVCYPMMGLHPTSVNENPHYLRELQMVEEFLDTPPQGIERFCAIGEVGLDFYWSQDFKEQQTQVFERQIELSMKHKLPLVIHTRAAWTEMAEVLGRYKTKGLRGVMHAFSGDYGDYLRIKECGDFMFGVGGVVTYKNSGLAELLEKIPLDDIVLETDCPYLAPVPFRGKRNETGYLAYICSRVAAVYGLSAEETARKTSENASRMFGL